MRFNVGVFLFLLLWGIPTAGSPAPVEGNIDDVAKVVLSYFPRVTGKVTAVDGDRLRIDVGKEKGLTEGVLLTIYREKEPFYHPVTGILLGRYEETVATAEVTQIEPESVTARLIRSEKKEGSAPASVAVGDGARLSAAKIPLAVVMAPSEGLQFLGAELVSALSETGRFRVESLPPQTTREEALRRNNLYLIQAATSRSEGGFALDLQLQNTESGQSLSSLNVRIKQSEESDLILEHLQYQLFEQSEKSKR